MPINEITGLYESHNHYLNVPVVKQKNGKTLRLNGQIRAIHDIPTSRGVLSIFSNAAKSDLLLVIMTDQFSNTHRYSHQLAAKLLKLLGRKSAFLLPDNISGLMRIINEKSVIITDEIYDALLNSIIKARSKTGASKIIFVGQAESANLALILSTVFEDTYVLAVDPIYDLQIDLSSVDRYKEIFPEKTTIKNFYSKISPVNYMQVVQDIKKCGMNITDYLEFKDLFFIERVEGKDFTSRKIFKIYKSNKTENDENEVIYDFLNNPRLFVEKFNQ